MMCVLVYTLVVRYLSHQLTLLSPFLGLYCLLAMVGATLPDIDWLIMRLYPRRVWGKFGHRNPLTHSILLPLLLWLFFYWLDWSFSLYSVYEIPYSPTVLLTNMENVGWSCFHALTIGIASHLLADNIKTGNLVWIPHNQEKWWYTIQGGLTIALLSQTGFFHFGGW